MEPRTDPGERSPLLVLVGTLGALGLLRAAGRIYGLLALLGVVVGTVAAFAILILVLRLLVLH